ncbi:acyl-CoA N-acyltransferase [Mycena rebaudengoi]|nr:acyl-CoA N-acyltransferase [Mycena rebaudengoi]
MPIGEPYVRAAQPSDFDEISAFEARAFADDPEMNWFGGRSIAMAAEDVRRKTRSLENLRVFLDSVTRGVHLVGGRVAVVAIPRGSGGERLVAFAAWVPPHKVIEGTLTVIRSKSYRSVLAWGISLLWRATVVFKPTIGAIVKKSLKSKGYQETDHWRLEITATDPEFQGKGFSSLLMKEGFPHCNSRPITLEATTSHSRDIYAHQGFEVVEVVTLGKGDVNDRGLTVKDKASAEGFPVWVMIKWPTENSRN